MTDADSHGITQIALLRGINLGSYRRVAMPALRELLSGLGYDDVRTYLQSGNVVLRSALRSDRLARQLERELAAHLSLELPVVVRTRDELAAVLERNPLREVAADPKRYQVSFLSAPPAPEVVRALRALDVSPERFVLHGREVYAWHPDGLQRSSLARRLTDKRLGVTATARNWSTATKLLELAER